MMTFEQWTETAVERAIGDVSRDRLDEMTGGGHDDGAFDGVVTHADGGWVLFAGTGAGRSYFVHVATDERQFPDLARAQRFLWDAHSRFEAGQPGIGAATAFTVLVQRYVEEIVEIEVEATDADDARAKARQRAGLDMELEWKPGDDMTGLDVYAVQDADGEAVWTR